MRPSHQAITLVVLSVILISAAVITWLVLERRATEEEESIRAAHPLRIASNVTASTTLFDLQGNKTSLEPYAEAWTIVTSWATWCPTCSDQLFRVASTQQRFANQGVVAIAYNRSEPVRTIEAYQQAYSLPSNLVFVRDTTDTLYEQFDGYTMPETVIVSPAGKVTHHFRGTVTEATLIEALDSVVSKQEESY